MATVSIVGNENLRFVFPVNHSVGGTAVGNQNLPATAYFEDPAGGSLFLDIWGNGAESGAKQDFLDASYTGTSLRINTTTVGYQYGAAAAFLSSGAAVVVFTDDSSGMEEIRARL